MEFPERVTNYKEGRWLGRLYEEKSTKHFATEVLHAKFLNKMAIFSPLFDSKFFKPIVFHATS